MSAPNDPAGQSRADELAPGYVIEGRYRVERLLGAGAFGKTYAAEDLRERAQVAVKQLSLAHVSDWKTVELFEREARTLAALDHSRIPDYIEFLPIQSERSGYLVQTLAPGCPIADFLAAGRVFSEAECLEIARQVLDVLVYLSARQPPVIHRDIKPANLILDLESRAPGLFLVDFGAVQDAAKQTMGGGSTIVGTFGYMAPEQFQGMATTASDLYGLGMTLIHMLSGLAPTDMDKKRLQVDFRKYIKVSPTFEFALDRLIAPVPEDRFESAAHALQVLDESRPLAPASPQAESHIEALILARENKVEAARRKAELQRQQHRALIARQKHAIAPAVTLHREDGGMRLEYCPQDGRRFGDFGLAMFVTAAVIMTLCLSGIAWAIIAQPFIAILINVLMWCAIGTAGGIWGITHGLLVYRRNRVNLQVSDRGNFALYHHNPAKPRAFGRLSELSIRCARPGLDRVTGTVSIAAGDLSLHLDATDEEIDQFERFIEANSIAS